MPDTFRTRDDNVVPAVTTEQMREIDRIAIEETGPNLFQMMENAGRSLAQLTMQLLGTHWQKANIVVLAGGGGNGGGGICAARHLADHGGQVQLALATPDRLGDAAAWQRHVFRSTPGREALLQDVQSPAVILDAVIGYSLRASPTGAALTFIKWANEQKAPALSLDVPSGLDATTGETPGEFIRASTTLTLALPKTGLLPEMTGELFLADIGIPRAVFEKLGLAVEGTFGSEFIVPLQGKTISDKMI